MPIPIQCAQCQQSYKVDDRLAGKKVKCRNCGASILVPLSGVQEEGGDGLYPPPTGSPTECPSCRASLAPGARLCLSCGFDTVTGRVARTTIESDNIPASPLVPALSTDPAPVKRKAWTRPPANSTLESLDELLKIAMLALLVAGIIVAAVHISHTPTGLSLPAFLPILLTLAYLFLLIAPLAVFGITTIIKQLKILPREDNYTRVAIVLVFPFAISLIAGWGGYDWLVTLSWFLAPALLIYLFRAELIEWVASVLMTGTAVAIGAILINLLADPLNSLTGPLYADMLPGAPWTALAKGHTPAPQLPVAARPTPDTPEHPTTLAASPGTQLANTQQPATITPIPTLPPPIPETTPSTTMRITPNSPSPDIRPSLPPAAPPKKITSPFFANIINDDPGLKGVADIIAAGAPSPYFLAIKNDDTAATIERWSVSPVQKSGEMVFSQNLKLPNTYALSPKGDLLATLAVFPRIQLEIANFDTPAAARGTPAKKIISLTPPQPRAAPTLLGFLDQSRVLLRWDLDPDSGLSIWNISSNQITRNIQLPAADLDPNALAISPNGRTVAVLGAHSKNPRDKEPPIYLITLDTGAIHNIDATTLPYKNIRLAFSPDSTQIAIYAMIADIPTIMSFKVPTGEPVYTAILSNPPPPSILKESQTAGVHHALLWLNNNTWLVGANDVIDAATGKKTASLGILDGTALQDVQLAGPSSILLAQPYVKDHAISVARLDDARLSTEKPR